MFQFVRALSPRITDTKIDDERRPFNCVNYSRRVLCAPFFWFIFLLGIR